jgi:cobalt-zinc-cadmium efflux system outer membrane protein
VIVEITCDLPGHTRWDQDSRKRLKAFGRLMARVVLGPGVVNSRWLALAVLAGCLPSQSAVFGPVDREVAARVGTRVTWSEDVRTPAAIEALLAKPLDLDAAVRIALARNRRLQASFDELGISASQVADATVLPPMTVDADYKRAVSGSGSEIELLVVQDILALFQIGQRRGAAGAELRGAQARAVAATVELAARVEVAFDDALAADQDLALVQTAFDAAAAAADLVERQHAAGNVSDLDLDRQQEQRERTRVELARAQQAVAQQHAMLGALLGAGSGEHWSVAGTLPALPAEMPMLDDLEPIAVGANLDLAALRADADAAAARHRYAMVRTFVPELGVGVAAARREVAKEWEVGPAIRIGIPLFDQQQGPRARSLAEARRARNEAAATKIELAASIEITRSRVHQRYVEARQLIDVVAPLRKRILEETVLHYNAMDANTFELLVARRDMVDVARQSIEVLRQYWGAMAEAKALRRGGRAMRSGDSQP